MEGFGYIIGVCVPEWGFRVHIGICGRSWGVGLEGADLDEGAVDAYDVGVWDEDVREVFAVKASAYVTIGMRV